MVETAPIEIITATTIITTTKITRTTMIVSTITTPISINNTELELDLEDNGNRGKNYCVCGNISSIKDNSGSVSKGFIL